MVSLMTNGPIPPHPYYDKTDPKSYVNLPAPRVRPEAESYYQQAQGSVGMVLQVEGHRVPSGYRRNSKAKILFLISRCQCFRVFAGSKCKDHVSENVRRMRRIQREAKTKEEQKHEPVKALWKSNKYSDVPSKVNMELTKEPPAPRPHSANYLRAHSRTGYIPQSARAPSTEPPPEKLTIPRAQSAREVVNVFVNRNSS